MPDRYKGSAAVTKFALHGQPLVEISGSLRGLDGFDADETQDDREIPGGGTQIGRQKLGYFEGTVSGTVDENEVTKPLFWGKNGRRFDFEHFPEGESSGRPKYSGESIFTITHNFDERNVRRFSFSGDNDGRITYGTV